MAARGAPLRGVLFVGLMVEGDRLSVLEYNCVLAIPNANR
jgi:phosphoribosylamine-glycine ligase